MNLKKYALLFIVILINFICPTVFSSELRNNEKNLNDNIAVGTDIYVQHDINNNDIFLLTSEGEETTVYQIINATYTASKQWTRDGLYIDDLTGKISATAPEDYISVRENEVYFVRLYGIGDIYTGVNGDEWHITTPIVYFDDYGNCVGHALSSTVSASKAGVEIIVPSGATRMYISNYNNQNISIQKKLILNADEFSKIKDKQEAIFEHVETNYEDIKSDPIIYSDLDKGYITFVNDDTKPNVDKFADLFIAKKIPLAFAAVADNLLNIASNLKETRFDVALRIQEAGGEILAHNASVITESTINDNNFMYNYFVVQKQLLSSMGLNVNGIILAGGSGQITGSALTAKWASSIYKYSDLLGEKYDTSLGIDSVYYHYRTGLGNYNNDVEKIKDTIDETIKNKKWTVFYFHDINEISLDSLEEVLDYINSKSSDEIEVVTYSTMYDKFAQRESTIKSDKKTYYVSSNGKSKDGTDINDPINLDTLNTKTIKTGDTILFKSGDTFFGTVNLDIANIDDEYVTISNYGEGELPTISTYKYISNSWEKYSDNIYRIDIENTDNYIGYESNSEQAFNVGFLEDDNGNKYYNKKVSIQSFENTYDFYSDGSKYLYMYLDSDPYEILGNLKVVVRSNLINLSSNMKISNIRFSYTGGHAMEGASTDENNIIITNCIIENIGGSYLYSSSLTNDTRYGNGIEFYGSNARDIVISNNIFRNIYDVAFTIQGPSGSGTDIYVYDNAFINNSQDSEIWENGTATGVYNYQFYNNLSINQGRGWGYEARPDKYPAASILFWGYEIDNTDILFNNNILYNPRQIYYLSVATDNYFLSHNTIKSDNNVYYMSNDTKIYRNNWDYDTRKDFISTYKVDINSIYSLIEPDLYITKQANILNNINEIRLLVLNKEDVIKSIELVNVQSPLKLEVGNTLDLKDLYLKVNYFDGLSDNVNLDVNMLSDINYQTLGIQVATVNYLGYTIKFNLEIVEKKLENNDDGEENNSELDKKDEENNSELDKKDEENNSELDKKDEENNTISTKIDPTTSKTQISVSVNDSSNIKAEIVNTNMSQQKENIVTSENTTDNVDEVDKDITVEDNTIESNNTNIKTTIEEKNNFNWKYLVVILGILFVGIPVVLYKK